jgi:hypothetical protein
MSLRTQAIDSLLVAGGTAAKSSNARTHIRGLTLGYKPPVVITVDVVGFGEPDEDQRRCLRDRRRRGE